VSLPTKNTLVIAKQQTHFSGDTQHSYRLTRLTKSWTQHALGDQQIQ